MVFKNTLNRNVLPILLLLVISANYTLYHTSFGIDILPKESKTIVVCSILDLAVISPILLLSWKRKMNWNNIISGVAGGLVLVRFFIPIEFLAPFKAITWVGFAVEVGFLLLEIFVLLSLFKYLPNIISSVKKSSLPIIFSFSNAIEQQVKTIPIIQIICSEMLMFYYAIACWGKSPKIANNQFTLHQKTSLLAFQIVLIHSTILEMVGIDWWLHEKSFVLSLILLLLNIYTVIFLIGDIQAVRHNPLLVTEDTIYLSLGLMKRMEIKWMDVEEVIHAPKHFKHNKCTIEFIARSFDEIHPDFILKLKHPVTATLIMGIKKEYSQVALKVDEPHRFIEVLKNNIRNY
ncbi:beta-carotene 15,15'-monooxygenase [Bacillus sp. BRMEA1]|uniref:beta-carotene 15,15'-monooxygenase n=1 Tax=Neobacillus endophyticus TaxID=2738405 RepID=UPI001564BA45|nr:beta-carotene 15,15'-monooxygenase [Neobacillus endophyticus]NRD78287.1 beta-carotene 15,15'-monooxygenase [Neobacillus endophyticus]